MRLIDADRLNEVIERNFCYPGCLKQIVDAQPTVYDADKVVERLDKEVTATKTKCPTNVEFDIGIYKAIEIIKSEMKG